MMKRRGGFARVAARLVPTFLAVVALSVSGCANATEAGNLASVAEPNTLSQNVNNAGGGRQPFAEFWRRVR
ncbi:hypothetical protein GA0061078_1504 [Bifidobacterium bohemicum]|uniref:Lipoprotein n=1 Tax=Bifidobacterium bohemicum DSM 22767 TaxID=1437606 RepID=A0A086ZGX3_9BIFI|nr:hypothetical protein BBOH_0575 [Bifidobacterium bohemicum DSM 22767]SCC11463.1 hypothetical protein GA0061078_1504 [Bifidobacterium bohemicum]